MIKTDGENRFARKYLLLCRHVLQLDVETKALTPERWQLYVSMFSESGFEVYETMGQVMVGEECSPSRERKAAIAGVAGSVSRTSTTIEPALPIADSDTRATGDHQPELSEENVAIIN